MTPSRAGAARSRPRGWSCPIAVRKAPLSALRRSIRPRSSTTTSRTTTRSDTVRKRSTNSIGVPTAINVGDYLIGLGYRLVSRERAVLGADVAADILDRLADSHVKLSEGQGAELLWRDTEAKELTALDALKIYALKTSPAFEAALYSGVRLAGSADAYEKFIPEFSRNLGVAFQILNDLNDWAGDDHNKLAAGRDALSARPTLLFALALGGACRSAERAELLAVVERQRRNLPDADPEFDARHGFANGSSRRRRSSRPANSSRSTRRGARRWPTRSNRPRSASCCITSSIRSSRLRTFRWSRPADPDDGHDGTAVAGGRRFSLERCRRKPRAT